MNKVFCLIFVLSVAAASAAPRTTKGCPNEHQLQSAAVNLANFATRIAKGEEGMILASLKYLLLNHYSILSIVFMGIIH